MEKLLFTPEEAAGVLSVGRSTVYELMRRGPGHLMAYIRKPFRRWPFWSTSVRADRSLAAD